MKLVVTDGQARALAGLVVILDVLVLYAYFSEVDFWAGSDFWLVKALHITIRAFIVLFTLYLGLVPETQEKIPLFSLILGLVLSVEQILAGITNVVFRPVDDATALPFPSLSDLKMGAPMFLVPIVFYPLCYIASYAVISLSIVYYGPLHSGHVPRAVLAALRTGTPILPFRQHASDFNNQFEPKEMA